MLPELCLMKELGFEAVNLLMFVLLRTKGFQMKMRPFALNLELTKW